MGEAAIAAIRASEVPPDVIEPVPEFALAAGQTDQAGGHTQSQEHHAAMAAPSATSKGALTHSTAKPFTVTAPKTTTVTTGKVA